MPSSSLLPELFAGVLRDAVTRFLRLDPNSPQYLAPLIGKIICLRLMPIDLRIYLCPDESSMDILLRFGGEPDVTLSGSPLAFARMGLSDSPRRALFDGEVTVEGDMTVAQRFQTLFERLDIDWEGVLSRFTGQTLAGLIANDLRNLHAWGKETVEVMGMNVAEYFQEESRELPAAPEADMFFEDVDTLRADYDRLEARVLRMEARLSIASDSQ